MNEQEAFDECKRSLEEALDEIKDKMPELWEHLKKSIVLNEESKTFGYFPNGYPTK